MSRKNDSKFLAVAGVLRKSRVLQVIGAFGVCIAAVLGWRLISEPRFEGRGIRSWIDQLPWDNSSTSDANRAIDSLGIRAVPFLLEAAARPEHWNRGLLGLIPRSALRPFVNLQELNTIGRSANWKLAAFTRDEIDEAELSVDPKYPIMERVLPFWKHELEGAPSAWNSDCVTMLGPKATNLAPSIRKCWSGMKPAQFEWGSLATALAESHDSSINGPLVSVVSSNYPPDLRARALHALAKNNCITPGVSNAVEQALKSTNLFLASMAISASAHMGVCLDAALETIERHHDAPKALNLKILEAVIRWRKNPRDERCIEAVRHNLRDESRFATRMVTADLIASAGADAKIFLPDLTAMARLGSRDEVFAVRAMREIAPAAAHDFLMKAGGSPLK